MYEYSPDEIDRTRADYQAKQHDGDKQVKRVGNLGELAFEQFCREYLPTEMWEWANEEAIRRCNEEDYTSHDFRVFGYDVDVKTSRDVSAFRPQRLVEVDTDDDIIVMAWHRDKEDSLILIGWEFVRTLVSKVETQAEYSGDEPEKLRHIPTRPMNELNDLGPNTAFLNQKPTNPFEPGDRVQKAGESDASEAIVVEALPPETQVELYGTEIDGEAVRVAYPSSFDDGPMPLDDIPAALLASYCDDQDITVYTYKHENLEIRSGASEIGPVATGQLTPSEPSRGGSVQSGPAAYGGRRPPFHRA